MTKRISSTDGHLKYALKLARTERYDQALQVLARIKDRSFSSSNLIKVALIHSYGGELAKSESNWLEIERRNEMQDGGYLMLASLQIELSKTDLAIKSLEKEINISKKTGNQNFIVSAAISLAYLQIKVKNHEDAKRTLYLVEDNQGDFIPNVGYKTKVDLLVQMQK